MRILFDQAVHDHRNKGNNSLLEVALKRLRGYWPDASFEILSISPHFCRTCFPGTLPVHPYSLEPIVKLNLLHRWLPRSLWRSLFELREILHSHTRIALPVNRLRRSRVSNFDQRNQPILEKHIDGDAAALLKKPASLPADLYHRIANYDLYMATGGGYMCDIDKRFLLPLFDRMAASVMHGVPTVMVGQGIGPLQDVELLQRGREVLPTLDYIMIREEKIARPLLDTLAVPSSKAIMTGDDAIELAYQVRNRSQRTGIGISLRVAQYTQISEAHLQTIGTVVRTVAKELNAPLIAAPIDVNEADMNHIQRVMEGYGSISSTWQKFEPLPALIRRIGCCRVMVASTFHGAVFALSQGIPVIALARTTEYHNKLGGLATEFGAAGCQVLHLDAADLAQKLSAAIRFAWLSSAQLQPQLLQNAKRQIDLSHAAYQKIFELVEESHRTQEEHPQFIFNTSESNCHE